MMEPRFPLRDKNPGHAGYLCHRKNTTEGQTDVNMPMLSCLQQSVKNTYKLSSQVVDVGLIDTITIL
jgi:hypothetical protein